MVLARGGQGLREHKKTEAWGYKGGETESVRQCVGDY